MSSFPHKIGALSPFLDKNDVIRVGGRMELSKEKGMSQKHQILLPMGRLANLLLRHLHERNCHAGQLTMMSLLKNEFWIVRAKSAIKKVLHDCVRCFKANPISVQQYMSSLPEARVTVGFPFESVAVDYAGYYTLKSGFTRNAPGIKTCYMP